MRARIGMLVVALLALTGALTVEAVSAPPAGAVAPVPTVLTPPPGTHGIPLNSSVLDLASLGYVEEEFFIEGTARAYAPVSPLAGITDGRWDAQPSGDTAPFRVRILVRRPVDEADFNGTVIAEWFNVTSGRTLAPDWGWGNEELVRGGYAWVGVSAQYVGWAFEQAWETGPDARYASLVHPGDSYSYDIFSQAGQALVTPDPTDLAPLGSLTDDVVALIADGESQSANRLVTYVNAIHQEASVYDAFLIHSAVGAAAPVSQADLYTPTLGQPLPPASGLPQHDVPTGAGFVIRDDLPVPIMTLSTETDIALTPGGGFHAQPDTSTLRFWELAGIAHADVEFLTHAAAEGVKSGIPPSGFTCGQPPVNDGPHTYAVRNVFRRVSEWTQDDVAPPTFDRLATDAGMLVRDAATGIAAGGLRLPDIEVPTRTITGERPPGGLGSNPFCVLFGASDPWNGDSDPWDGHYGPPAGAALDPSPTPEPDLDVLYPTKADYVAAVVRAAERAVAAGSLLPEDAEAIILDAAGLFTPVTPTRVADTRDGTGGVPRARLEPGEVLRFHAADTSDVPEGVAAAVALNVTAAAPSADGYLTVHPCVSPAPGTSNVNFLAGQIAEPNAVVATVDAGSGDVCVTTFAETDVVVDVTGWFAPGGGFVELVPERVADTRDGTGGVAIAPLQPDEVLEVDLSDDPAVGAAALNVTAANTSGAGYLTVFPCDDEVPYASNVNYEADRAGSPSAVLTDLDDEGRVCVATYAAVDVVVDLTGFFTTDSSFVGRTPERLADTRDGTGGVAIAKVEPGSVLTVDIPGDGASAAVLNVTATEADAAGFLTAYPCSDDVPYASTVNFTAEELSSPNAALVGVSRDDRVCIVSSAPVHVVVDITGSFLE